MTVLTNRPDRLVASNPARRATLVLGGVVLANLMIVEVLYATARPPAHNTLTAVGRFLGLHLAFAVALQLVLIARLPYLERRIGMDRLTVWHRWTGLSVFWLVLLHPTAVLLGYGQLDHLFVLREIPRLARQTGVLLGMMAAVGLVVMIGFSVRWVRRRVPYELWHAVHMLGYAVVVLALIHQLIEGSAFKTNPLTRGYWYGLWAFAILALLTGRVITPVVRNLRHGYRVDRVVPESDSVVSVHVTGRDLGRLAARPGQFFIWRFPRSGGWWRANPFSLSAAPDGHTLRLTVKAVGTGSARLRTLAAGTRVFAEGPYGALTAIQRTRPDAVLIAGGIGVTPIRALLEELTGDVLVLYRVRTEADAVLLAEMRAIARERGAVVRLISGPTSAGQPFSPPNLTALVPDIATRDVYVCGPEPMTGTVLRSLRELGVPRAQIHTERFRLAG